MVGKRVVGKCGGGECGVVVQRCADLLKGVWVQRRVRALGIAKRLKGYVVRISLVHHTHAEGLQSLLKNT